MRQETPLEGLKVYEVTTQDVIDAIYLTYQNPHIRLSPISILSTLSACLADKNPQADVFKLSVRGAEVYLVVNPNVINLLLGKVHTNLFLKVGGPNDRFTAFIKVVNGFGDINMVASNNGPAHAKMRKGFNEAFSPFHASAERTVNSVFDYIDEQILKNSKFDDHGQKYGECEITFDILSKLGFINTFNALVPEHGISVEEVFKIAEEFDKYMVQLANATFVGFLDLMEIPKPIKSLIEGLTNTIKSLNPDPNFIPNLIKHLVEIAKLDIQGGQVSKYGVAHHLLNIGLSDTEVISNLAALFPAASNTTAAAMLWTLSLFHNHPTQFYEAKTPSEINSLIYEILRHRPILEAIPRTLGEPFQDFKKGSFWAFMLGPALRNPHLWGDNIFYARRFLDSEGRLIKDRVELARVAFGAPTTPDLANNRHCAGEAIAIITLKLFIEKLKAGGYRVTANTVGKVTMAAENSQSGSFTIARDIVEQ